MWFGGKFDLCTEKNCQQKIDCAFILKGERDGKRQLDILFLQTRSLKAEQYLTDVKKLAYLSDEITPSKTSKFLNSSMKFETENISKIQ